MKRILIILLLVFYGTSHAQTIRLLTYNIHHANPPSRPGVIDLQSIAKVINAAKADVVAIQEVDILVSRSEMQNQAELLSELTGMEYFFAKGIDLEKGYYGTLLLSRHPIIGKRRYDLPMPVASENRALAIIDVQLPGGKIISVANTHLDLKKENRIAQAQFINEVVDLYTRPFILMGDLNSSPQDKPIQILLKEFIGYAKVSTPTFPTQHPKEEIDYIMVNKNTRFSWLRYEAIQEHEASDHLPLLAEIEL